MSPETILQILTLGLRFAEAWLKRRPPSAGAPTRADQMVARMAPLAEKALNRITPSRPEAPALTSSRRRASPAVRLAGTVAWSALISGTAAYLVVRQQRRLQERYRRLYPAFPEELLAVLAAPGGGGRLLFSGASLIETESGAIFPVVDGIPDFSPAGHSVWQPPTPAAAILELTEPWQRQALGLQSSTAAVLAGRTMAAQGWMVCTPCAGRYALEIARINPAVRVLCIDPAWERLLELRREARQAGFANLYWARGQADLLPVQDAQVEGVWVDCGTDGPAPAQFLTQAVRVARSGARVGGIAPTASGLTAALVAASGLEEAQSLRQWQAVSFSGRKP